MEPHPFRIPPPVRSPHPLTGAHPRFPERPGRGPGPPRRGPLRRGGPPRQLPCPGTTGLRGCSSGGPPSRRVHRSFPRGGSTTVFLLPILPTLDPRRATDGGFSGESICGRWGRERTPAGVGERTVLLFKRYTFWGFFAGVLAAYRILHPTGRRIVFLLSRQLTYSMVMGLALSQSPSSSPTVVITVAGHAWVLRYEHESGRRKRG